MLLLDVVKASTTPLNKFFNSQPYTDVVTQDSDTSPCKVVFR